MFTTDIHASVRCAAGVPQGCEESTGAKNVWLEMLRRWRCGGFLGRLKWLDSIIGDVMCPPGGRRAYEPVVPFSGDSKQRIQWRTYCLPRGLTGIVVEVADLFGNHRLSAAAVPLCNDGITDRQGHQF